MVQKNYKKIIDKSNIRVKLTQFKNFNIKLNNYNSKIILSNKIVNCLMLNGKKSLAEKIFYKIFNLLQNVSLKNSKINYLLNQSFLYLINVFLCYMVLQELVSQQWLEFLQTNVVLFLKQLMQVIFEMEKNL